MVGGGGVRAWTGGERGGGGGGGGGPLRRGAAYHSSHWHIQKTERWIIKIMHACILASTTLVLCMDVLIILLS